MGGGKRISDDLSREDVTYVEETSSSSCEQDSAEKTDEQYLNHRRKSRTYAQLMESYESPRVSQSLLSESKGEIKRYEPGDWIHEMGGTKPDNYQVPATMRLLLVGPRGSGKSSLVNRITRVLNEDSGSTPHAQVSHSLLATNGTCFVQEYMILRDSRSLCVYDTRSLSMTPSENFKLLQRWMRDGVHHGEMVIRDSDTDLTRKRIKAMARHGRSWFCERWRVNFVIFVINGVSVLNSMNSNDTKYIDLLVETFNYPFLSFEDSKPVVVVTHGDELSLNNRAHVRNHLGEILGIPPTQQVFDIPDRSDNATDLAIVNMLKYCIKHAERSFFFKWNSMLERVDYWGPVVTSIVLLLICVILLIKLLPSLSR